MDATSHVTERGEILRLLRYSRPYTGLLVLGTLLMALMAAIEGLVAFSLKPALDIVLNPHSSLQTLELFRIWHTNRVITLNSFVPRHIHNVWNIFAISFILLFLIKGAAEYFGAVIIQYVGLASIMDLRNDAYSKVIQQPGDSLSTIRLAASCPR